MVAAIGLAGYMGFFSMSVSPSTQPGEPGYTELSTCPTDGDSDLKINVYNPLNTSGSENYDVTLYGFTGDSLAYTITDTTSPTATTVNCGENILFKPIGTTGASGDKSYIVSASGTGGDISVVDGNVNIKPTKGTTNVILQMQQHATLECKAYDNFNKGLMYDNGDSSNTDYETDGVTWTSTTDNSTAYSEANDIDIDFTCRAIQTDTDYNDRGIWVLIEAPAAVWDEPTVLLNGVRLAEATTQLNNDERKAYADYEYVYLIPQNTVIEDGGDGFDLTVRMELSEGVSSATADPEIDFAVRTQYLSTDGMSVKEGSVTDASSPAQIISLYDMTLDVT